MPNGRASPIWNWTESRQAREQLDTFADGHAEFNQIWEGVRWLIIRDPINAGRLIEGRQQTYVIRTLDFLAVGMPEILVIYSLIDLDKRVLEVVEVIIAAQNDPPLRQAI